MRQERYGLEAMKILRFFTCAKVFTCLFLLLYSELAASEPVDRSSALVKRESVVWQSPHRLDGPSIPIVETAYNWVVSIFNNVDLHHRTQQRLLSAQGNEAHVTKGLEDDILHAFTKELEARSELVAKLKHGFQFDINVHRLASQLLDQSENPTVAAEKSHLQYPRITYGLQLVGFRTEQDSKLLEGPELIPEYKIVAQQASRQTNGLMAASPFQRRQQELGLTEQLRRELDFKAQLVPGATFVSQRDLDAVSLRFRQVSGYYECDVSFDANAADSLLHRFWLPLTHRLGLRHTLGDEMRPILSQLDFAQVPGQAWRLNLNHETSGLGAEYHWATAFGLMSLRSSWADVASSSGFSPESGLYEIGFDYHL